MDCHEKVKTCHEITIILIFLTVKIFFIVLHDIYFSLSLLSYFIIFQFIFNNFNTFASQRLIFEKKIYHFYLKVHQI